MAGENPTPYGILVLWAVSGLSIAGVEIRNFFDLSFGQVLKKSTCPTSFLQNFILIIAKNNSAAKVHPKYVRCWVV